jgi:hypothetical protein
LIGRHLLAVADESSQNTDPTPLLLMSSAVVVL